MHFDLNLKSLTMSGLKIPPLIHLCPFHAHAFPLPLPRNGHQTAARDCNPPLLLLGGLGERLSSPSGSGRSPAAKRFLMHLWAENEVWERLNSLNRLLAELVAKHAF